MILKNTLQLHTITREHFKVSFLPTGHMYDMMYDHIQINLQKGNIIDGQLSNIYLRFEDRSYIKLFSQHIDSMDTFDHGMKFYGHYQRITYTITMYIYPQGYVYDVELTSQDPQKVHLYYGQDLGIQDINGILNNEAYIVQYIDYKAFKDDHGYTLCARQNQGQPNYFQMGMSCQTIGYVTDAMQFFKTQQKADGHIHAMDDDILDNHIYQYEQSYLTLQSDVITLSDTSTHVSMYGYFEPNHEDIITVPKAIKFEPFEILNLKPFNKKTCALYDLPLLKGHSLSLKDIETLYPNRYHEEYLEEKLASFFLDDDSHVTLDMKESILERSTGHILIQGDILKASEHVLTTTSFMNGIFLSHIALGNTSFHKLLGDHRHALMLHRMAGFRLYLQLNDTFHLLGMPSSYEIGFNHMVWTYVLDDDSIHVYVYGDISSQDVSMTIVSDHHKPYTMFFTMQLLMGPVEWLYDLDIQINDKKITIQTPASSMAYPHYPDLTYTFEAVDDVRYEPLTDGMIQGHFTLSESTHFSIAAAFGQPIHQKQSLMDVKNRALNYYKGLLKHLTLSHDTYDTKADMTMLYWYTHNALIHYAAPHGLEQYNGAAWGTRDVCQGPFELFSALQQDDVLKHILITVYRRQFLETGDFPQWFMYDKYAHIQAHESHGDVIFWPLKALGYYLKQTGDHAILDEMIDYYSLESHTWTNAQTLFHHVKHQIQTMMTHTIHHLPIYGGGDWDDTLQPINNMLKEKMVSGWTTVLMIQSLQAFAEEIHDMDPLYASTLHTYVEAMKESRKSYLLPDQIPAGFVVFDHEPRYLLHPKDLETGLKYRLLPLTRSMIAGLTTEEETKAYLHIIDTHLKHPDGVRLMNHTVLYQGGKKTHFNRAETAANFGREIGLQYVHAHIRYMEAMYEIHAYDRAFEAFMMIHPIHLHNHLKHALPRQRNSYFSSSDADFKTRYEAMDRFNDIKSGSVHVKGGWRIYSSGPGILIHQMITQTYGITRYHKQVFIRPKLPEALKALQVYIKKGD